MGHRTNHPNVDLKEILPEELEAEVKEAAEISMGSEVTNNICYFRQCIVMIVLWYLFNGSC